MEIAKVQFNQNKIQPNLSYNIYRTVKPTPTVKALPYDKFERTIPVTNSNNTIQFTGLREKLIGAFLKNTSYNRSLRGSKRPYIPLSEEIKDITQEIQIPVTKKESINALDINPNNSKNYIIFLHVFSHNITSNQPLYKSLSKSNYGILAIDYRGYGKNPKSKNIKEQDIIQDIEASIGYLKTKGVDNIGLVGHSFGGYLAAKISDFHDIAFQVLVAPLTSLEFWLKNVLKHPKKYSGEMKMIKYIPGFKEQYSKIFNITKYLELNPTPTYIVQSKQDRYIRTNKITELTKIIPNLKKYIIISTGGHRMDENKIKTITQIVNDL